MKVMIASNRVETAVRMVVDAARKATEEAIGELENRQVLTEANFQRVLAQGDKVAAAVKVTIGTILAEIAENVVGHLRLISGGEKIVLAATNGTETLAQAQDIFTGYVDPRFKSWGLDVPASPMPETEVAVYEMEKSSTFAQLFGGFGENLDRLCFTQAQIRQFCRDPKSKKWLHPKGWPTFFLFEVGNEYFVARVYRYEHGKLRVNVRHFSRDVVWSAEDRGRVVVPQLALES